MAGPCEQIEEPSLEEMDVEETEHDTEDPATSEMDPVSIDFNTYIHWCTSPYHYKERTHPKLDPFLFQLVRKSNTTSLKFLAHFFNFRCANGV